MKSKQYGALYVVLFCVAVLSVSAPIASKVEGPAEDINVRIPSSSKALLLTARPVDMRWARSVHAAISTTNTRALRRRGLTFSFRVLHQRQVHGALVWTEVWRSEESGPFRWSDYWTSPREVFSTQHGAPPYTQLEPVLRAGPGPAVSISINLYQIK